MDRMVPVVILTLVVGLVAPATVSGQISGQTLNRAVREAVQNLIASISDDAAVLKPITDAVVDPTPILVTTSFVTEAQVETMPQGAILGAVDQCPVGWEPHTAEDGAPLFVPFGLLVDVDRTPRVGDYALLRACTKQ